MKLRPYRNSFAEKLRALMPGAKGASNQTFPKDFELYDDKQENP